MIGEKKKKRRKKERDISKEDEGKKLEPRREDLGPGGGHSPYTVIRVCAAAKGILFTPLFSSQGYSFHGKSVLTSQGM